MIPAVLLLSPAAYSWYHHHQLLLKIYKEPVQLTCEFDQFYPVGRLQYAPCWHCQHSCVIIRASFPSSPPKQGEGYRKSASVQENTPKKI